MKIIYIRTNKILHATKKNSNKFSDFFKILFVLDEGVIQSKLNDLYNLMYFYSYIFLFFYSPVFVFRFIKNIELKTDPHYILRPCLIARYALDFFFFNGDFCSDILLIA